jgi:3-oxoacyl-[acyl-carrier protein] reductase
MQGLGLGRPYSQLRQYSTRVLIWDARLAGLVRNGGAETRRRRRLGVIAFGLIQTRLTQAIEADQATIDIAGNQIKVGIQPQTINAWIKTIPLGRAGAPEEAAGAVYLFCLPESDYITGQVIVCSGGLSG